MGGFHVKKLESFYFIGNRGALLDLLLGMSTRFLTKMTMLVLASRFY